MALQSMKGMHVKSALQFDRTAVERLIDLAAMIQHKDNSDQGKECFCHLLEGSVMAPVFYENSSRTFCSFVSAMQKLGGGIVHVPIESSSVSKGESLSDTVATMDQYADVIVLRHPKQEALDQATAVATHPVLNAGNGTGEHPTQALLDCFTIKQELGTLDGLEIAVVGDLLNGRTVHSLVKLLANFQVKTLHCVSPAVLAMPAEVVAAVEAKGITVKQHDQIAACIATVDVVYVTRTQKERFATEAEYNAVKGTYEVNAKVLSAAKAKMIVMHPLPRNDELSTDVDADPRAAYFRQMKCGLYMRMALLLAVLDRIPQSWSHSLNCSLNATTALKVSIPKLGDGVTFATPFMNAAGVMCMSAQDLDALTASTGGSFVTKSCTLDPRQGNPEPRYYTLPLGSINSMGLPNNGFQFYLDYVLRHQQKSSSQKKNIFFSMSGMSCADNVTMAKDLHKALTSQLAQGSNVTVTLELNLSCPNVPGKPQVGYEFETMDQYLKEVTSVYPLPLGVKLPPYFDIAHFDRAAEILNRYPSVQFLTCINSVGNGLSIDVKKEQVVIKPKGGFGGIGGQFVLPTALANVHAFFQRCPEKIIFGCGGVTSGHDAFCHVLAGATMVQIGTQLHEEGVSVFERVAKEMLDLMEEKGYKTLDDFRGKLKVIE